MKADTKELGKMNIEKTALHRRLRPEFVRWYRDVVLSAR
jgi:hypothetical protein